MRARDQIAPLTISQASPQAKSTRRLQSDARLRAGRMAIKKNGTKCHICTYFPDVCTAMQKVLISAHWKAAQVLADLHPKCVEKALGLPVQMAEIAAQAF